MKKTIYSKIIEHAAFIPFNKSMLPTDVSRENILKYLLFMSPSILILHGSQVSKKRHSSFGKCDLDIICVTIKASFWPLSQLYEQFCKNTRGVSTKIDLSILSYSRFLSVLKGETSLSISLNNGFSILYMED
ncbi:MAG: hypothetical protein MUO78_00015 [candidate division Zixibacteria bacterium]|nr:hypothetical protein [candidate division Zixibacteria bacterium]